MKTQLRIAKIEWQPLYLHDVVIIPYPNVDVRYKYMVFYDERMYAFSLIPLDWPHLMTLSLDYLIELNGDWEYLWPVDIDN